MVHKLGIPPPSDEDVQMSPEITRSQNSSNRIQTQNTNSGLTLNSNAGLPNLQPSSNPKSLPQTITLTLSARSVHFVRFWHFLLKNTSLCRIFGSYHNQHGP